VPILSIFKTKKKRSRRAYLIKCLDDLVSKQVRERDGHRCRKCGRERVYHHHVFGKKAHPSTRWVLENGISLCYHCHVSAHASQEDFRRWVMGWMGEKAYEVLYIRAQMRTSFKTIDLEWLLKDMRRAA
jgi:hypothetical protein